MKKVWCKRKKEKKLAGLIVGGGYCKGFFIKKKGVAVKGKWCGKLVGPFMKFRSEKRWHRGSRGAGGKEGGYKNASARGRI